MKIGLKKFNLKIELKLDIKLDLTKTDWSFRLQLGTLIATVAGLLK